MIVKEELPHYNSSNLWTYLETTEFIRFDQVSTYGCHLVHKTRVAGSEQTAI